MTRSISFRAAGASPDWCRNLEANHEVTFSIDGVEVEWVVHARSPTRSRTSWRGDLVVGKYQPCHGGDLSRWRRESRPFAIDLA